MNSTRRGGKTFTLLTIAFEVAIQYPKAHVHFAAPFQNQIKEYLLPLAEEIMADCPDDLRPKWLSSAGSLKLVFSNGSFIKLCGIENRQYNNLRGNWSDFFIFDEARDMDSLEIAFSSVASPQLLSSKFPGKKIVIASTPPETPDHAFKAFAEVAMAKGAYSEYNIDECWYSPEEVEEIKAAQMILTPNDPSAVLREFYCKFVTSSTLQIIPEWANHPEYIQEVSKDDYFQFYYLLEGMDIGYRDFTAWILGYYDWQNGRLVIEDEIALRENECTTERLAALVKEREKPYLDQNNNPKRFKRISDNNNLNVLADLSKTYQLPFAPVSKKNGKEWMVNQLRQFVGQGKLIVHPRCKKLISSLAFGIWKKDKTDFERSKELGHYDFVDALVYLVAVLLPTIRNVNPIPPLYRINVSTTMFPNGIPQYGNPNPNDTIIRKMFPRI